jgi:hypothetical protein
MHDVNELARLAPELPPLHHGDVLSLEEFEQRYANSADVGKAELIDGMVYLQYDTGRVIDPAIPPLENGDHLSLEEFDRRYSNMPDLKKAELINGVVFMPPPISGPSHGFGHSDVMFWLGAHRGTTPGVRPADNTSLRLPDSTEVQPDAMVLIEPAFGGDVRSDKKGRILGLPELAAEVSYSSASYDLHVKLEAYRKAGIAEYMVWRTADSAIDWFVLRRGRYARLRPDADRLFRSRVLPGLWLEPAALFRGDIERLNEIVRQGAGTPEHLAFVRRLSQARDARNQPNSGS